MKKVYLSLILMFLVSIFVLGCGGEEISTDKLKFKASNVVFRSRASAEFTDQKVYADDVVLNNANTSLTADNVQTAFEETQPKLSEIIVGEWDVACYLSNVKSGDLDDFPPDIGGGTITFNEDGTLSTIGRGWILFIGDNYADMQSEKKAIKYNLYNDTILNINWQNLSDNCTKNTVITFETITQNKLVYKHPLGSVILTKN